MSDLPPGPPIAEDRAVLAGQIAFVAAPTPIATEARAALVARYGECPLPEAVVVVALGGDGFMLETIHQVVDPERSGLRHEPRLGRLSDEQLQRG